MITFICSSIFVIGVAMALAPLLFISLYFNGYIMLNQHHIFIGLAGLGLIFVAFLSAYLGEMKDQRQKNG